MKDLRYFDPHRRVFALTALVLVLPLGLEAMLVGITATMICYVLLNLRYRPLMRTRHVPT